jgi:hypothetical protein
MSDEANVAAVEDGSQDRMDAFFLLESVEMLM